MQQSPKPNPVFKPQETQANTEQEEQQVDLAGAQEIEAPKPERKKRYYSPSEVMKKKGCIGCGGMVLALVSLAAGIVAVLALL